MTRSKSKAKVKNETKEVILPDFEDCCDFDHSDFSDFHDHSSDSSGASEMVGALIEASNFQASLALELTKLILTNAPAESKTEECILNTFSHASKTVFENASFDRMWKKLID